MTNTKRKINCMAPYICFILIALSFIYDKQLKEAIINGMNLAALKIIPTLFPFMIISDYWISCVRVGKEGLGAQLFEKVFKINRNAIGALITGLFAGFPLGVKSASDLYRAKAITLNELQRLVPIINLPSLAFVISGVGLGLYNDIKIGFILYFSVLSASAIVGFLNSAKSSFSQYSNDISKQSFDFALSIKQAGLSSINISSYIIFFSGLIGLVNSIVKNNTIRAFISSFLEIGNATLIISECSYLTKNITLALISFALGFSGISVHFQAFSFLPTEFSRKKYLFSKLIIGILSSIFTITVLSIKNLH